MATALTIHLGWRNSFSIDSLNWTATVHSKHGFHKQMIGLNFGAGCSGSEAVMWSRMGWIRLSSCLVRSTIFVQYAIKW